MLIFLTLDMQTYDKARNALALALSPVVKALVDPDGAMVDIRNLDSVRPLFMSLFGLTSFFWSGVDYLRGLVLLIHHCVFSKVPTEVLFIILFPTD